MARLRAVLSVLGIIGVIGVLAVGGFWFLRGPVLAASADVLLAAESLFIPAESERPLAVDGARPAESPAVVDAATVTPVKAALIR